MLPKGGEHATCYEARRMCNTLKSGRTLWGALLLLATSGLSLTGAQAPTTNAVPKAPAWNVVAPTTVVQQPPVMTSIRVPIVMVNVWDDKFAVTHDGKVREFKMAHGGLLFRKGKPTTLESFAVGQEIMLVVYEHPNGRWDLLSASLLPHERRLEAAGSKAEKAPEHDSDADKHAEKEARRRAKAEAKAQERAEEEAREQAEAEAKAQRRADKEARKLAEAEAEQQKESQEKADKEARRLAESQAKAQKQADKEARKQAEAEAEAQKDAQKKADKEARDRAKAEAKAQKEAQKQAAREAEAEAKARKKAEKEAAKAAKERRKAEEAGQAPVPDAVPASEPETAAPVPAETPEN